MSAEISVLGYDFPGGVHCLFKTRRTLGSKVLIGSFG
jgi:hypothetical protein